MKTTVQKFGRADILVNNTGGPPPALFLDTSVEDWRDAVSSLLMSVINCCKKVIPYMKRHISKIIDKEMGDGLVCMCLLFFEEFYCFLAEFR